MATKSKKTSAKGAGGEKGKKPVVPKIINVMDIKARPRGMTLVHFTAAQWKGVARKLKRAGDLPQKAAIIEAVPLPGGRGDMLLGGQCGHQRGRVCYAVPDPIREPGRRPDQFDIGWTCICPEVPAPPRPKTKCTLRFSRVPPFGFYCDATHCPLGCVMKWTRLPDGRYLLGCECREPGSTLSDEDLNPDR